MADASPPMAGVRLAVPHKGGSSTEGIAETSRDQAADRQGRSTLKHGTRGTTRKGVNANVERAISCPRQYHFPFRVTRCFRWLKCFETQNRCRHNSRFPSISTSGSFPGSGWKYSVGRLGALEIPLEPASQVKCPTSSRMHTRIGTVGQEIWIRASAAS